MRLPLTLSTAGHAIVLALLILLVSEPSPPEPLVKGGIEVVLGQSLSQPQAVLAPEAANQPAEPSTVAALPPQEIAQPEPVVAATEPPPAPVPETLPPDQTAPAPPPPQKPLVRQPPKTVVHRPQPRAIVSPTPTATPLAEARSAASPSSQYSTMQSAAAAAMPATVPGPDLTANYSAMISAWLEAHKHYPESARERGEEAGGVKLRFRVDRFGRVLDYRLLESTGYADLDAGIDQMMRGAQLPPFPSGMTQSEIEVSVKLRFKLAR